MIKADIPGLSKDVIKVTMDNGLLTIQGERQQEKHEENKRFHRIERFYGSFTRRFSLLEGADLSVFKAAAEDGQLTVTISHKQAATTSTVPPAKTRAANALATSGAHRVSCL
ncbi:MAG: Hsp20/alpha crystallin family protein [Cyanobacteria bacterium]|nr:Hsp20/alpha crystallin family protein [Cyanobacteriota bacterium]